MEKSKTIEKLFYYIVTSTYLALPIVYLILPEKKKYTGMLAIYGVVAFSILAVFDFFNTSDQRVVVCIYTIVEYLFFAAFLYTAVKNTKSKRLIIILSSCFVVFHVIYFLTVEIGRLDSVPIGIETILIFLYVFIAFYELFKNPEITSIYNTYSFWLALGMLVYLGGSFFFNIMINYISKKEVDKYLYITYVPEVLKNIFFSIVIFLYTKNPNGSVNKSKSVPYLDMV